MSYHTWTVDGYGICTSDITGVTKDGLLSLTEQAPEFCAKFRAWAESENGEGETIEEAELEELLEWEDGCGYTGLAPILEEVILEAENIRLICADDYNGNNYLLFEPRYPWSKQTPEEMGSSERGIKKLFEQYVGILTDDPIVVAYYSVENGG